MLVLAISLNLNAQEASTNDVKRPHGPPPHSQHQPKLNKEQKKLQAEMLKKYDANKDGKLDREERTKISKEDRQKMHELGLGRGPGPNGPRGPRPHDGPPPKLQDK